ncbi:MAG: hypothetical protein P4L99_15535 [Chthoniobacter sp.]|nr:hypothetical protein [Chthoniobacter sp.]
MFPHFPAAPLPIGAYALASGQCLVDQSAHLIFLIRLGDEDHAHAALPLVPCRGGLMRPTARSGVIPAPAQRHGYCTARRLRIGIGFQQKFRALHEGSSHGHEFIAGSVGEKKRIAP